jgi:N-acetylglucosaminyldiphosphoundecaprenol N-acetyl-beta-D-mannosaminyltransferase
MTTSSVDPPQPKPLPGVTILGLTVHNVTMQTALEAMDGFFQAGTPHHVVTADASMLVLAQEDSALNAIVCGADLVTPDSVGVLWASKQAGAPLQERVSGVEIVDRLCCRSVEAGYRLFFLGAGPGVAAQAAEKMRAKYPGTQIVGTRDGFFRPEETDALVAEIRESRADALFVAMGIPKQEKWIAAHRDRLGAAVLIGVGGTFDVLSGNVKRAPKVMQKVRLEWLWRVVSNPRKISKVLLLPRFVRLVRQARKSGER